MKKPLKKTTGAARRAPPVTGATETPKSSGLPMNSQTSDDWALPAIRGVQAQHEYYVVLVRLRELPCLLAPIDAKVPPELRVGNSSASPASMNLRAESGDRVGPHIR